MSEVEVFLDDTPGEVRGVIARDGRFERLLIQRQDDPPQHRLGARVIGRVTEVDPAFRAAFVDLDCEGPAGFLPLAKSESLRIGEIVEVEVTAEPRERKGPTLRRLGPASGRPRLLVDGPEVEARLRALAPGVVPVEGTAAIQAGWDAEEEALSSGAVFPEWSLDVAVQRTRALVAVDIDYAHRSGRAVRKGRAEANRRGLSQAARLIRLKGWGGLIAVDLVGTALDPSETTAMAKEAFTQDGATIGPLSRFGLLQLAVPWRTRPVEETLNGVGGRRSQVSHAIDVVRRLRHGLLSDTTAPRLIARCDPETARTAGPLIERLGPRAGVRPDPTITPGRVVIEEI